MSDLLRLEAEEITAGYIDWFLDAHLRPFARESLDGQSSSARGAIASSTLNT
jgi:hypothetical protein